LIKKMNGLYFRRIFDSSICQMVPQMILK